MKFSLPRLHVILAVTWTAMTSQPRWSPGDPVLSVLRMFLVHRGRRRGRDNGDPWSASPLQCFLWLLVHDALQDSIKMRACCGIIAVWGLLVNLKAVAAQGEFLTSPPHSEPPGLVWDRLFHVVHVKTRSEVWADVWEQETWRLKSAQRTPATALLWSTAAEELV